MSENAVLAQRIADLTRKNVELKAQVMQLRIAYKKVSAAIHNIDDTETDSEEIADALWSELFKLLQEGYELCHSTSDQCLAEHDAKIIEKAIALTRSAVIDGGARWLCRVDDLEKYANQLRQKAKEKI